MKQLFFLIALLLPAFSFSQTVKPTNEFRYPGEWEPMEAIWIYASSKSFLAGPNVEPGMMACIKELTNYVKVHMMVGNDTILQRTKNKLVNNGIDVSRISFVINRNRGGVGTARDKGPAFMINDMGQLLAVDFDYISMFPGMTEETRALSEKLDRDWAALMNIPVRKAKVVSEGGARESNGKGTLILVEKLEFKRNIHLRKKEIQQD